MNIKLNNEQEAAVNAMLSGQNVFISGPAGCGKSTIINKFKQRCRKQVAYLAPTGIAAHAIGGATIHSFFKLSTEPLTSVGFLEPRQHALLQAVEVILIDEISMCRSDLFQTINTLLQQAAVPGCQHLPFGGTQIIVIGDMFQLPPVADREILNYLELNLDGIYAFNTQAWHDANFETILLNQVHRQSDPFFCDMLEAVRYNTLELHAYLASINEQQVRYDLPNYPVNDNRICICCTKKSAEAINHAAMSQLPDQGFYSHGDISEYFPYDELPTNRNLEVKHGARVLLLASKQNPMTGGFDYVNGSTGVVVNYDPMKPSVTVRLDDGNTVMVEKSCWSNYEYDINFDDNGEAHIEQVEVGQFYQLPLAPAYAITIHKAQGKTLDSAHVVLGSGCFAHGQLYTALSRVRSLEGLTLDRPIQFLEAIVDPQILDFYSRINSKSL